MHSRHKSQDKRQAGPAKDYRLRPISGLLLYASLAAFLLVSLPGEARTLAQKKQLAKFTFDRAEQLREALNGRPAKQRTAREYERVISAYRQVYYTAPTSNKADASALTVAELLAESARAFHNLKGFHASIEQYEFLRREYPGSKYRMGALFSIGQIYREDLLDYDKAQSTFQDFLKHYPGNHLAEQARTAITEMQADLAAAKARTKTGSTEAAQDTSSQDLTATGNKNPFHSTGSAQDTHRPLTPVSTTTIAPRKHGQLTLVTGIRHWSTPDYTRVAIDIDDEVQYEAGRVPSPDRIFFDLDSTRLAPELAGKSFDIQDGFLKKVRVAQFKSDKTRVVLEVDQLADYSAFLLPNPYRLIIDIHGKFPAVVAKRKTPELRASPTASASGQVTSQQTVSGRTEAQAASIPTAEAGNTSSLAEEARLHETKVGETKAEGNTGLTAISKTNGNANTTAHKEKDRNAVQTGSFSTPSVETGRHNTLSGRGDSSSSDAGNAQTTEKPEQNSEASTAASTQSADNRTSSSNTNPASNSAGSSTKDTSIRKILPQDAASISTVSNSAASSKDAGVTANASSGTKDASNSKEANNKDSNSDDLSEIADLTQQPNEVKATDRPTSGPIAQSVAPRQTSGLHEKESDEADNSRITVHKTKRSGSEIASNREAQPNASGDRSLIRALGLKIGKIVIDAGHGGHDTGTIGPGGLQEKDLVLDVALRLGKLLQSQLGAEVVYTRSDDTFIPLETRTAIANKAQADLFISIHANSSRDPSARGIETYYLNFTASPDALEVAARENAVSEKSIHELQDLVKKIALKEKIEESREFAANVQQGLYEGFAAKAGMKNRGVKKAPFIVLIGANMPSILAEISFVSNPRDEKKLRTPEYRQKIAESLGHGVEKYIAGLSGVKLASNSGPAPALGGN